MTGVFTPGYPDLMWSLPILANGHCVDCKTVDVTWLLNGLSGYLEYLSSRTFDGLLQVHRSPKLRRPASHWSNSAKYLLMQLNESFMGLRGF